MWRDIFPSVLTLRAPLVRAERGGFEAGSPQRGGRRLQCCWAAAGSPIRRVNCRRAPCMGQDGKGSPFHSDCTTLKTFTLDWTSTLKTERSHGIPSASGWSWCCWESLKWTTATSSHGFKELGVLCSLSRSWACQWTTGACTSKPGYLIHLFLFDPPELCHQAAGLSDHLFDLWKFYMYKNCSKAGKIPMLLVTASRHFNSRIYRQCAQLYPI